MRDLCWNNMSVIGRAARGQKAHAADDRADAAHLDDPFDGLFFCVLRCGDIGGRKPRCDESTGGVRGRLGRMARSDSVMLQSQQRESVVSERLPTQAAVEVDSDDGVGTTGKKGKVFFFPLRDRLQGTKGAVLRRTVAREVIGGKAIVEQFPTHNEFEFIEFRERGIK